MSTNRILDIYKTINCWFFLYYVDVPSVSLSKVSYSVASGSVTLECSVTSTLAVTNVFWQRQVLGDIETINSQTNITKYSGSSTSNPSLTILNALPSDEGSYVCFASSSGGQGHSGITKLSVTGGEYILVLFLVFF